MSRIRSSRMSELLLATRKLALTATVVGSFTAYALHERAVSADGVAANALPLGMSPQAGSGAAQGVALLNPLASANAQDAGDMVFSADQALPTDADPLAMAAVVASPTSLPTATMTPTPTQTPTPTPLPPTPLPSVTSTPIGPYADGTYDGPVTDALYGPMQVRVLIQNGQIAKMQVLDYPHDRRTSVTINHIALPRLAREVMRAQNAAVDIISGATLSSQAFLESLASALEQAQPGAVSGRIS